MATEDLAVVVLAVVVLAVEDLAVAVLALEALGSGTGRSKKAGSSLMSGFVGIIRSFCEG